MRELFSIGIGFRDQFVGDVELQVVAIGADDRLGESDRCIASRPMERGFEHDLLRGIALRLVEPGGGLGFAENVGDPVIADAIAGAKITVRVVVESAPADAAGILRIGRQLVVDAGVAQRVFGKALHLVDGLGRIGVADEFGVQIARMIGRLQRESRSRSW